MPPSARRARVPASDRARTMPRRVEDGVMDTHGEQAGPGSGAPEPDDGHTPEWMFAHAKAGPGLERHVIPLGLFDPIPPAVPRPFLLMANLVDGEPLRLQRIAVEGRARPDFLVTTPRGRDLGRLTGQPAAMIEFARCEGLGVEVSMFASVPSFPPEVALMLELAVVVWCRPEEWVDRPTVFRARREK